jgi:hypothetical protein
VLLLILVCTSIAGAIVTSVYAIETKGVNLERIGESEAPPAN